MKTKYYSVLITLGLAATAMARASFADVPVQPTAHWELVIDTDLRVALRPQKAVYDLPLDLALASPGLLLNVPGEFFAWKVHLGSAGTTTPVVFRAPGK